MTESFYSVEFDLSSYLVNRITPLYCSIPLKGQRHLGTIRVFFLLLAYFIASRIFLFFTQTPRGDTNVCARMWAKFKLDWTNGNFRTDRQRIMRFYRSFPRLYKRKMHQYTQTMYTIPGTFCFNCLSSWSMINYPSE